MKKLFYSVLILLFSINASIAQSLKTYNGDYDLKFSKSWVPLHLLSGKATYTYYEDENYERIRKGKFSYSGKKSRDGLSVSLDINGNYSKNLKEGLWKCSWSLSKSGQSALKYTSSKNYSKGYPHGSWRIDFVAGGKKEFIALNFNNNVATGKFTISSVGASEAKIKLTGQTDQEGFLDGVVKYEENDNTETIMTFDHGFLLKQISRNLQSGAILHTKEADPEELENYKKIQSALLSDSNEILEDLPYKVIESYYSYFYDDYNESFSNYSLGDALPGDLSYPESKIAPTRYEWEAFKVKVLKRQETRAEKLERERLEKERQAKLEAERLERERLEKERQAKLEAERLAKEKRDKEIKKYNRLNSELKNNMADVDSKYKVIDPIATAAKGSDMYKWKKKNLYKGYDKLLNSYRDQIKNSQDYDELIEVLTKANALCKHMLELFDQKTKELEKLLKKAETIEQIETILK